MWATLYQPWRLDDDAWKRIKETTNIDDCVKEYGEVLVRWFQPNNIFGYFCEQEGGNCSWPLQRWMVWLREMCGWFCPGKHIILFYKIYRGLFFISQATNMIASNYDGRYKPVFLLDHSPVHRCAQIISSYGNVFKFQGQCQKTHWTPERWMWKVHFYPGMYISIIIRWSLWSHIIIHSPRLCLFCISFFLKFCLRRRQTAASKSGLL